MKLQSAPASGIYGKSVFARRTKVKLQEAELHPGNDGIPPLLANGPRGSSVLRWAEERVCLKCLITRFPSQQTLSNQQLTGNGWQ